jgi:uncharacterized membrane protein YfcA
MTKQAEHRIRGAASLAKPGMTWAAAIVMNAPWVTGAAVAGWIAFTADSSALQTMAGILFALVFLWAALVTMESWRVLRRFTRRQSAAPAPCPSPTAPPPAYDDPPFRP